MQYICNYIRNNYTGMYSYTTHAIFKDTLMKEYHNYGVYCYVDMMLPLNKTNRISYSGCNYA